MADLCHEPHPKDWTILCDKPKPCYGYHEDSVSDTTWDGVELPAVRSVANVAAKVAVIVDQADRPQMTGPPVARRDDPATSHKAGAEVQVRSGSHRERLLKVYAAAGVPLTDAAAARLAEMPDRSCWWKRCSELREGGYIEVVGQMLDPETGALASTCLVTAYGLSRTRS